MILALDFGAASGWALHNGRGVRSSGTWHLPESSAVAAYVAFRGHLRETISRESPALVAYEDVPGIVHLSGISAHRWGGYEAVALLACAEQKVPRFLPVNPATWKRAADLGAGTDAIDALRAAQARWPGVRFTTPDEAVARWVAVAAAARKR